ncbi:hypothetical protein OJF2_36450 [Aquisphaera giovannonii]|uniref:Tetratricopeptide repeat protein n=1 Tax=Aquisphaera giovannonii TaxID=406548 RepID=A0A5B9W4Z2_9BACT|nr:tetratricopeptide repeat protein [Aquisphaera giovannonii]QEH35100.1 hypothetical protein OJF2_36450 [Aquisphaera giovannonii]
MAEHSDEGRGDGTTIVTPREGAHVAAPPHHAGRADRPAGGPSRWGTLLPAALVCLAAGAAGAWGYSHFFGGGKSRDESGASKGSSSAPDARKDAASAPAGGGQDSGRLKDAQSAWADAVKELKAARDAEAQARRSADESRAVLGFLERTLLAGRGSGDGALPKAFWSGGQGGNPTLRQAVDAAESQVGATFGDRPLAEASVREALGQAYLALDDAAKGVKQYERALALRQALQGSTAADTSACRNKLAVAYRMAGLTAEGERLFQATPDSAERAAALAVQGAMLLAGKKPAEAELPLRECVTIRRKLMPDDWSTFDAESALGQALLDQRKFVEAEPVLAESYEGLSRNSGAIPAADRPAVSRARDRLVKLYEAWGKPEQAAKWKADAPKSAPASPSPPTPPSAPR